jgi:CRP-like cAMP-binding protein
LQQLLKNDIILIGEEKMRRLFGKISVNEERKLLKLLETSVLSFKKDTVILSNVKDNIIGIILEGKAQIIRTDYNGNRTIIEELEEESIFGTAISSLSSDECEIITKEETKVLIIDYDLIISSKNNNYSNQFIKNLLEITTNIIEEKNERIEILTKKTIRDKLLEYFNIYRKKHASKIIYLPFSFTDLADFLAVDRSAMTRELKNLKEEGFIETKGRRITLLYK